MISSSQAVVVLLLLAMSGALNPMAFAATWKDSLDKAVAYLHTVAYNPDVGLCREAPRVAPNVYWVASDNLLAYKALEPYDASFASAIRSRLVEIGETYNLPVSSQGVPLSLRFDVVTGDNAALEMPPKDVVHITLRSDSYHLKYDIANATRSIEDWSEYADLLLLVALSNQNQGEYTNALGNFTLAANMWDGMGLRDKAYRFSYGEAQVDGNATAYATYKLGLLLYVAGKIGISLSAQEDIIARVWSMQNRTSGGIFTHMLSDGSSGNSDTNTETTALVILGMTSVQDSWVNLFTEFAPVAWAVAIIAAAFAVSLVSSRRLKRSKAN